MKFLLSTIADITYEDYDKWPEGMINGTLSAQCAAKYGMGLEIAEFCVSDNMDDGYRAADEMIRRKMAMAPAMVLHAPFNELFPCAIERRAAQLARDRFREAIGFARDYGIKKVVIHSGFAPTIYYESWFIQRSVGFWREFMADTPGDYEICLENVMETSPDALCSVVEGVGSERFRLCFDVGHAYRCAHEQPETWLGRMAPYISHFHIHNNTGGWDTHNAVDDGEIEMLTLLNKCLELCPDATFTVESIELERSAQWLQKNGFLEAN